jgi:predicted ATPase
MLRPRRLVGRDTEIREVAESIGAASVTTLTGPGGVGKTALAMAVAAACTQDFPGGVTVVWLGSLRSAELVATEVAAQLGLPRSGGKSYEDALTHWLTGSSRERGYCPRRPARTNATRCSVVA